MCSVVEDHGSYRRLVQIKISAYAVFRSSVVDEFSLVKEQTAGTEILYCAHIVRNKNESCAAMNDLADTLKTFLGKKDITHAERLVDDEDVRLDTDRDGKSESHHHAGRVR